MTYVGLFDTFQRILTIDARFAEGTNAVAVAEPTEPNPQSIITNSRAHRAAMALCLSIPAVRRARHVIAGTSSTFKFLAARPDGQAVAPTDRRVKWLRKPDRTQDLPWTLWRTFDDLIWHDRSVWRIDDRYVDGTVAAASRLHPSRIDTVPHPLDPDRVDTWIIDGQERPTSTLVIVDGGGIGGLQRYGFELLTLYGDLMAAAGRYATAPHPHAILKNSGADLTDEEIDELLDSWERARTERAVGYLNEAVDYETHGWNAEELQLVDAREHAALEVSRLFGLPSKALDAKAGDSMTYANAVEARRDIAESLRPWHAPLTAALSGITGLDIELDTEAYTRDDPKTRMETWTLALERNILSLPEVQALEPLAARRHP